MKVLVLGGAGNMAKAFEEDLLNTNLDMGIYKVSEITVADNDSNKIKARLKQLQDPRVSSAVIDVNDHNSLVKLIGKHDLVVNFSLTPLTVKALKGALDAGVNIITLVTPVIPSVAPDAPVDEIGLPTEDFLENLDYEFKKKNLTAILGLGFGPGITNIAARYIIDKLDSVETVNFFYGGKALSETRSNFMFSPIGMITIFQSEPVILKDGKLIRVPRKSGKTTVHFPEPVGGQDGFYTTHEEPISLYRSFRHKGLKNSSMTACWSLETIEKFEFLEALGMTDLKPRKVGNNTVIPAEILVSGAGYGIDTSKDVKTCDYSAVKIVAKGEAAGEKLEYTVDVMANPYKNYRGVQGPTGIPSAIGVRMLMANEINKKGAWLPEIGIDPVMFFKELSKRDIHLSYTLKYCI